MSARLGCFFGLLGLKKNKTKESPLLTGTQQGNVKGGILQLKSNGIIDVAQVNPEEMFHLERLSNALRGDMKPEKEGAVYKDGDEHVEASSLKRGYSNFNLQALACKEDFNFHSPTDFNNEGSAKSGHFSDPEIGRAMVFGGSPHLQRSCSNIETEKTRSHNELLKKRSSSQLLPLRSRKLFPKLYLRSHENTHNHWAMEAHGVDISRPWVPNHGGNSSDTLETNHESGVATKREFQDLSGEKRAELRPQKQWSFPMERVNAWVNSLDASCTLSPDEIEKSYSSSSIRDHYRATGMKTTEESIHENHIIRALNVTSTTAHVSGAGLKVFPSLSFFTSLRTVNLSGNLLAHITPGSLPKSLHTLDLSRNKIAIIEGLRDLTRLRVLNLSYNRISRISHGLSSCTMIKELYLAGNKISEVEGLHRLLKLTVLDLSFNRITTSKALGQIVANYSSLMAVNLLGNAIQDNVGDEYLRKTVIGLLPHLAYLNKHPVKAQRGREAAAIVAASDSIAKAALGDGGWGTRRRLARRSSHASGGSSSARGSRSAGEGSGSGDGGSKQHGSKGKIRHSSFSSDQTEFGLR